MGDTKVSRYTPRDAVHVIGLIEQCAQFPHNQTKEECICLLRPLCVCFFGEWVLPYIGSHYEIFLEIIISYDHLFKLHKLGLSLCLFFWV